MKCYATAMSVFPTPVILQSLVSFHFIQTGLWGSSGILQARPWLGFVSYQQRKHVMVKETL